MSKTFNVTFTVTGPETFTAEDFDPYPFDNMFADQGLEVNNISVEEEPVQ